MARKRYSDEDVLRLLREIELALASGQDIATACRSVGVSDATYYNSRKRFGGMGRPQLSELKALEKENSHLHDVDGTADHIGRSFLTFGASRHQKPPWILLVVLRILPWSEGFQTGAHIPVLRI